MALRPGCSYAARLAALFVCLAACKDRGPSASTDATAAPSPTPSPSPSASAPTMPPPAPRAPAAFTSVVVGTKGDPPGFFPAGSRALIAMGTTFWGYASAEHPFVRDAHFADGLPVSGKSRVQVVGGLWPDVAVISGEKELTEYAGANPVLFRSRQGGFAASKATVSEVARMAATSRGVTYLFVPSSSYFIAGLDVARCNASAPTELPVIAVRGDQKLAAPRAVASFFPEALENDASGNGFVVGGDMCRPGAFLASLDATQLRLELVPGSAACTERATVDGMPFTHAHLFPNSRGGLYVLLLNRAASPNYEDEDKRRKGACAAPPQVLERLANGEWSGARVLPANVSAIDSSGTAWGITDHRTVARIPPAGDPTELALGSSCVHPPADPTLAFDRSAGQGGILALSVPFPDQVWILVAYEGGRRGLCAVSREDVRP